MTLSTLFLFLLFAENIDAGGLGWVKLIQQFKLTIATSFIKIIYYLPF